MLKGVALAVLSAVVSLAMVEGLLRLQQRMGPLVDLEFNNISHIPSDVLNHTHAAREDWCLDDSSKYGAYTGYRYSNFYDTNGVRIDPLCRPASAEQSAYSVLFFGDSFIEGYDLENSVPRHVCKALREGRLRQRAIHVLNAGTSSYSPTIYIAQAKLLIPALRPDLLVVDIDETDLGDDYLRYRDLAVRDDVARITAVRSTPANRQFTEGFLRIKQAHYPLYLFRFWQRFRHAHLDRQTARARADIKGVDPLMYSSDNAEGAAQRYAVEIAVFEARVDELLSTASALMGGREKVLVAYHPHLQHLQPDARGRFWNTFVRDTLERVARRSGVAFYDATDDLRQEFGASPQAYYWPNDMHFNFEGLAAYARHLSTRIEAQLSATRAERLPLRDGN